MASAAVSTNDPKIAMENEHEYQRANSDKWLHDGTPTIYTERLLLQYLGHELLETFHKGKGNEPALHVIRKIYGVVMRVMIQKPDCDDKGYTINFKKMYMALDHDYDLTYFIMSVHSFLHEATGAAFQIYWVLPLCETIIEKFGVPLRQF